MVYVQKHKMLQMYCDTKTSGKTQRKDGAKQLFEMAAEMK